MEIVLGNLDPSWIRINFGFGFLKSPNGTFEDGSGF